MQPRVQPRALTVVYEAAVSTNTKKTSVLTSTVLLLLDEVIMAKNNRITTLTCLQYATLSLSLIFNDSSLIV